MDIFKRKNYDNEVISLPIKNIVLPRKEYFTSLNSSRPNADYVESNIYRQVNIDQNVVLTIESLNTDNTNVTHGADIAMTLVIRNPNGTTYNKLINFGDTKGLTLEEYFTAFNIILTSGAYTSAPQQQNIKNEMTYMINEHPYPSYASNPYFRNLVQKMSTVSSDWKSLGLNQIINNKTIQANKVNLILYGVKSRADPSDMNTVLSLPNNMFFNLANNRILTKAEAREMANDGFQVDDTGTIITSKEDENDDDDPNINITSLQIPADERPLLLEEQNIFFPFPNKPKKKVTDSDIKKMKQYIKRNEKLKKAQLEFDAKSGVPVVSQFIRDQPNILDFYDANPIPNFTNKDPSLLPTLLVPDPTKPKYNQAKSLYDKAIAKRAKDQKNYDRKLEDFLEWQTKYNEFMDDWEKWKIGQGLRRSRIEKPYKDVKRSKIVKSDINKQMKDNNNSKLLLTLLKNLQKKKK
jgi:hypothetical protein